MFLKKSLGSMSSILFQGMEAPMVLVNIDLDIEKVSVQSYFSQVLLLYLW